MTVPCARCGAHLPDGAQFCVQCGQPVRPAVAPAAAVHTKRSSKFGLLPAMGLAAAGLFLCLLVLVGLLVWRSGNLSRQQAEAVTAGQIDMDEADLEALETSVERIESAFRDGDVDTAVSLTHPALRDDYATILQAHAGELERVANLLATRKLLAARAGMAEYQVTEDGRTFSVTFEAWGDQWYLSGL